MSTNILPMLYWLCIGQHSCCINYFYFSLTHPCPLQARGVKVYSHHCCSMIQWNPKFFKLPWKRKINVEKYEVKMWMSMEQTLLWSIHLIFCSQGFTSDQMRLAEENTAIIEQREKEIQSIVQSISELNEIFRDLATMIVEQVSPRQILIN